MTEKYCYSIGEQCQESLGTPEKWETKYKKLKSCVEDNNIFIAFYAGNFTASRKPI